MDDDRETIEEVEDHIDEDFELDEAREEALRDTFIPDDL